jgi:hypothetical protein
MLTSLALFTTLGFLASGSPQEDFAKADLVTKRLAPAAFASVPLQIRHALEKRGCTIPQTFTAMHPGNVISGRFTSAAKTDWAALCSVNRVSSILVFRDGSASSVAELASFPDSTFLQVVGPNGAIGYSREIVAAAPGYVAKRNRGNAKLPRADHDGINDLFVEKGSSVWFWDGGHWLKLDGAD